MRFGAFFIGLCMLVIAGSLGAVAYLALNLTPVESAAIALTVLSLLTAYNAFAGRARDRAHLSSQMTDLSRGTADLARQVGELGRRLVAVEGTLTHTGEQTRMVTEPLTAEIDMLGTLVKQVAESVAAHEVMLLGTSQQPLDARPPAYAVGSSAVTHSSPPGVADEMGDQAPPQPDEILQIIRAALEGNRVDLYLQPIVTLPQRKVRYYEAVARLRTEDGSLLLPADYLRHAETGGLMPLLDNLMLFRAVQVARRLTVKNREVGLFCNIAGSTLTDSKAFAQFFEFLSANQALGRSLTFEFSQAGLRAMGPIEHESLAQLSDLGFRFSLDHVTDLQIEPRALAEQGFRFVKIPATLLLSRNYAASDIHPSDLSDLLSRHGIELIAERIESEGTVVDLLDYDVRFGQGYLFSPPRPVRNEVLQGAAEPSSRARAAESPPIAASAPAPVAVARIEDTAPAARPSENEPAAPRVSTERGAGLMQLARNVVRRA